MTAPDLIVLHAEDDVATALRDVPAGTAAKIVGENGLLPVIMLSEEIRLGHKTALREIRAGELVVKHGHPIGRAIADIAPGVHVHTHNVVSLSYETDLAPSGEDV